MRCVMLAVLALFASPVFAAVIPVDTTQLRDGPVQVTSRADALVVRWTDERSRPWTAEFSLDTAKPLLTSIAHPGGVLFGGATPQYWVETGKRRGGWDQFFDFPPSHPDGTRRFQSELALRKAVVRSKGERVEVYFEGLRLGHFTGGVAFTFYPGSRLVEQEAVASTAEPDTAYYYDAGLQWTATSDRRVGNTMQSRVSWYDAEGRLQDRDLPFFSSERQPVAARYRSVAVRLPAGALAVFPAPHRYFMPRDFTSNLGHLWARSFRGQASLGIRQLPDENWIYYPWMNAPSGTEQRMGMFLMLSDGEPRAALEDVQRYTNRDRFPSLSGYKTLSSHFHLAYTVQAMERGDQWVPPFKPVLKSLGIDAVMIADFHGDGNPRDTGELRLKELEAYYRACRAQSDAELLIIPAEEANIHLGGHWVLAFPKQVLWFMSRAQGQAFSQTRGRFGTVYSTANAEDMIELIRRENGVLYTAHPRTKGSMGFPDQYKTSDFFRDPRFLGAGWKQMPSDLSTLRQGLRALNLLDDMNNWGLAKKLVPEVDIFQFDHTHEVYAHMNAAYVRIDRLPQFDEYGKVLEKLRAGDYFGSTGEVLLPSVEIGRGLRVEADVRWTFPLAYAVVAWGDGARTSRKTIALDTTRSFGAQKFRWEIAAPEAKWARLEVWDVAGNGAFTNPVRFADASLGR
jgi:hypothetical protein